MKFRDITARRFFVALVFLTLALPLAAQAPAPSDEIKSPDPKWVVAVGACAVDGGLFAGSYAVEDGVKDVIPVDLHIPGCPPNPTQLLAGLLALLQASS